MCDLNTQKSGQLSASIQCSRNYDEFPRSRNSSPDDVYVIHSTLRATCQWTMLEKYPSKDCMGMDIESTGGQ